MSICILLHHCGRIAEHGEPGGDDRIHDDVTEGEWTFQNDTLQARGTRKGHIGLAMSKGGGEVDSETIEGFTLGLVNGDPPG